MPSLKAAFDISIGAIPLINFARSLFFSTKSTDVKPAALIIKFGFLLIIVAKQLNGSSKLKPIKYFENKNKIKVEVISDNDLIVPDYSIDLKNKTKKTIEKIESLTKLKNLSEQRFEDNTKGKNIKFSKKNFKKKKFFKKPYYKKTKSIPLMEKKG